MRIEPGTDGVSIWSPEIFGSSEPASIQDFLSRTFAVGEVRSVELRPATHFGRIRYASVANPRQILKKLGRALRAVADEPPLAGPEGGPVRDVDVRNVDARALFLDGAAAGPIQVSRIGSTLLTWRVRHQGKNTLRLSHPALRNRRDVVFRLEEELNAILGVRWFRASALTAHVTIRFDERALSAEHLARTLERAWPRLLHGLEGPPSRKRIAAAGALVVLSFTGQYLVPAVRRFAVVGVLLYSLPNVINGVKQLSRGEVGVYTLYTAGIGFLLLSGLPFASSVIALLMQFWPRLARRKFVGTQRRLFAAQRRRAVWARIPKGDGVDVEISVDDLRKDDLVVVRGGDLVPVDGFVHQGSAVVIDAASLGGARVEQRSAGDWIGAGALVRDGELTIRVERAGAHTSASYLGSLLPHAPLSHLPSLQDVERIANRNAKPTLALSALTLALTRTAQPAQTVLRPDYVTGPRLSAQLSALHGLGQAARQGIYFREPAALDRLAGAAVFVFDDTSGLERRRLEVANVQAVNGVADTLVADYALAAYGETRTDESEALAVFTGSLAVTGPSAPAVQHHAGVARYSDASGSTIEIATAPHVAASKIEIPKGFRRALTQHAKGPEPRGQGQAHDEAKLRPLWVLRDGQIIGLVSFARNGELVGKRVIAAVKKQAPRARVVYLSHGEETEARTLADALGIEFSHGGLDQAAKTTLIRGIGRPTVWIGDGADPDRRDPLTASTVSVSVGSLRHAQQDLADVLLPQDGLDSLANLLVIARAHQARLARDYRTVYAANLAGVGGAFLARFNALRAGLVSNLGTAIVYVRQARALDRLAGTIADERALVNTALPGA